MSGDIAAQLTTLLGPIYDAAVDPDQWPVVLALLKAAVGADVSALFHLDDTASTIPGNVSAVSGYPDSAVSAYERYFAAIDTRRPAIDLLPAGSVYVDDRNMAFADVQQSEIFQDFFRPLGLGHGMAAKLFADASRISLLSVHRPLAHGEFRPEDVALLESLTPHLVRALQLQRQLARARQVERGFAAALDHFEHAVFLVDRDSVVVEMNRAAGDLLARPQSPLQMEGRRLQTGAADTTGQLQKGVRTAVEAMRGGVAPPPALLRLPMTDAGGAVGVMIAPVPRGDGLGFAAEARALVFASDPAVKVQPSHDALMRLMRLSSAEASVVISLVNGSTVEEIADSRAVSRETVRRQVKTTLAKTGTHSQGQLIAHVTRTLAMMRGRQAAG